MKVVDLFAGFGGFSVGAETAGHEVVWAANHWPLAVEVHTTNHPRAVHACQDLRQADWWKLPAYDLLLASPACQGHSDAGRVNASRWGDRVQHKHAGDRATAWAVIDCVEVTGPKAVLIENVPAFREWPLYPLWREALGTLGYHVTEKIVRASHCGVPQRRDRLFVVATRGRAVHLDVPATEEPAFADAVDWDAPGWRSVSQASPTARTRLRDASARYGQALVQHVTRGGKVPLHEPIRTVTTKDHWTIVDGDRYRPLTLRELGRAMGFPEGYQWPAGLPRWQVIRGLGNAVCPPVAARLIDQIAGAVERRAAALRRLLVRSLRSTLLMW